MWLHWLERPLTMAVEAREISIRLIRAHYKGELSPPGLSDTELEIVAQSLDDEIEVTLLAAIRVTRRFIEGFSVHSGLLPPCNLGEYLQIEGEALEGLIASRDAVRAERNERSLLEIQAHWTHLWRQLPADTLVRIYQWQRTETDFDDVD